jgi:hypothetical protein
MAAEIENFAVTAFQRMRRGMTCHARARLRIRIGFVLSQHCAATLISPLRGQLLPEGEAFGAVQAKSLLPLGEGVTEGDG